MKKNDKIKYFDLDQPKPVKESAGNNSASPRNPHNPKKPRKLKKGQLTGVQKTKSALAVVGTTFLTMFLIMVITVCIVAVALTVYVMQFAENSFEIDLKAAELNFTSVIMVREPGTGEWIETKRLSSDEMRTWVDYVDMPQYLIDAVIANEDHRYFEHEGVDWYRTVGVIVNAALGSDIQGGSTITQQLVKNVTGDDKVNAGRKLREIFRALSLEQKYTKIDILEAYLNRIGFGGTSYGVGSAARYYFNKDVEDLTIAECALLAGIIPSPTNYNPYVNPRNARIRQLYALESMYTNGFINTSQYNESRNEQIQFSRPISPQCRCPKEQPRCAGDYFGYIDERYNNYHGLQSEGGEEQNLYFENMSWDDLRTDIPYKWNGDYRVTQNWYTDAVIWQVAADLAEQRGVTYEKALELIRSGGYTIYSNEDIEMQARLEEFGLEPMNFLNGYDHNADKKDLIQGSFVIMDLRGRVVALLGGIGEKEGDNCFNRATMADRAIGSTVKPISVYATAIEKNAVTYSTMIRDVSGIIRTNPNDPDSPKMYWPYNYAETFPGTGQYFPVWFAVQKSTNTIAVRTLQKIGFRESYSMLVDKLGFTTLDSRSDMNWSPLALGSFTNGMKLHELAASYQIFGNGGVYYEPYLYEKVTDHNGKTVLEQNLAGTQAIGPDSAWIVNRMMRKVMTDPAGSGQYANVPNNELIGKTGTSNDMKNLVFCALTPDYVGVYRIGYDDGSKELSNFNPNMGWSTLARVWGNAMTKAIDAENMTPRTFPADPSVFEMPYCRETGMPATSRCLSTEIGFYKQSPVPKMCDASVHDGTGSAYWSVHGEGADFRPEY